MMQLSRQALLVDGDGFKYRRKRLDSLTPVACVCVNDSVFVRGRKFLKVEKVMFKKQKSYRSKMFQHMLKTQLDARYIL